MRISDWSSDVCSSDLAIERAGAELRFLPAYSPDFNPIEMAFAKLKAFLKKHAPRTVDDLWDTIARGIDTFGPVERSAARRVGKECVSTFRFRWSPFP